MMPGTPQQNGKAEQFNCTIMDKAMSMLHTARLSNGFWEHAISMETHIYNCTPIRSLKWHTPHKAWNAGHVPDVSYFRVFGCKAYMHVPADKWRKLDAKAALVTFVGYKPDSKGYRLWDKNTCSVHLSRDVTFNESSFPARDKETSPAPMSQTIIPFYPVYTVPNMPAVPQMQAPSPSLTSAKINFSYSILFHLTTSYSSYFGGKKGISRNKTSFFLLMLLKEARMMLKTYLHPKSSDHKHHPYKDPLSPLPLKGNKSCPLHCHPIRVQYALSSYH